MRFLNRNFLLWIFLFPAILFAQNEIPAHKNGHVNDFANILEPSEVAFLNSKLSKYEDTTSTEIAIVIEKELPANTDVFTRSMEIAREWGLGDKVKNNGIIIYISLNDKKFGTRTARGTQGVLTDSRVGQLQRQFLNPYFKQKQYARGLDAYTDALFKTLAGEFTAEPKRKGGFNMGAIFVIIFILFIVIMLMRGRTGYNRGYRNGGFYWFPTGGFGGWDSGGSGGGSSGGGFDGWGGGGGGFDGGGADGGW